MEPEIHHRLHKCPPPVPILNQLDPVHTSHPTSWRSILILSFIYTWVSQVVSFPVFPPKPCIRLSSPYALQALSISFFSILPPEQYLVSSTEHYASHYVVFPTPLSPRPSYPQIFPSTPHSQTPSAFCPPSVWATKFHTHTILRAKL